MINYYLHYKKHFTHISINLNQITWHKLNIASIIVLHQLGNLNYICVINHEKELNLLPLTLTPHSGFTTTFISDFNI